MQEHGSALSRDDLAGGRIRTSRQETARPQQQPALGSSPMDAAAGQPETQRTAAQRPGSRGQGKPCSLFPEHSRTWAGRRRAQPTATGATLGTERGETCTRAHLCATHTRISAAALLLTSRHCPPRAEQALAQTGVGEGTGRLSRGLWGDPGPSCPSRCTRPPQEQTGTYTSGQALRRAAPRLGTCAASSHPG